MVLWLRALPAIVAVGLLGCSTETASDDPHAPEDSTTAPPLGRTGGSAADGDGSSAGGAPGSSGGGDGDGSSGGDGSLTGAGDGSLAGADDDSLAEGNGGSAGDGPGSSTGAGDGSMSGDGDASDPVPATTPDSNFMDLSPPMGEAFDPAAATALTPAAPADWDWFPVSGTQCRDGSELGVFVRFSDSSDKLLIYFEGGGACTTGGFCNFNPPNVDMALGGDGETAIGSALGAIVARQQPGVFAAGFIEGIFDHSNAQNPFQNWNMVYIPYCSGDVHFGTRNDVTVPSSAALRADMPQIQQFVGHYNTQKIIGRVVPTFKEKVDHVIVTGASAGSFGALLNYSMISDAFGGTRVDAIGDSGAPFSDEHWPVCLQKSWRELWGFDDAFPPDCEGCFAANGGGMLGMSDFLMSKHPETIIALVSAVEDDVIRLFFAPGQDQCATIETADPVAIALSLTHLPGATYQAGLTDLRDRYKETGQLGTYYLGGANLINHQHIWRNRFYDPTAGTITIAQFVSEFLEGTVQHVGP